MRRARDHESQPGFLQSFIFGSRIINFALMVVVVVNLHVSLSPVSSAHPLFASMRGGEEEEEGFAWDRHLL